MDRWKNQQEAYEFALTHDSVMLDMDMGTGKTRTSLDVCFARKDVRKILIVCPKSVVLDKVWRKNLEKFEFEDYDIYDDTKSTVTKKSYDIFTFCEESQKSKVFVCVNYDIVWREPLAQFFINYQFDLVILDESHRAKSAGSKISKYLHRLGKKVKYKMCLSGTPMANSSLDVYGQYRFLDDKIFGTNHQLFLQEYAILGGPEKRFIVGVKNQIKLNALFKSIAYSCKMSEVADKIKLPNALPPIRHDVELSPKDMKVCKDLEREFIAECEGGSIVVSNVLVKMLRLQQITSGFCLAKENVMDDDGIITEINTKKEEMLEELLSNIEMKESIVVFCIFKHDLDVINKVVTNLGRKCFELSGRKNEKETWDNEDGSVLAIQIQAGAEGIDLTKANFAIYFSLPHSLALYNQSKSRLYRPGQTRPVSFHHIIAAHTVDEGMYKSLLKKEDVIESIKSGTFDFGSMK